MLTSDSRAKVFRRIRMLVLVLIIVIIPVVLIYRFYRWLEPADRVVVTISNIDLRIRSFHFIVDTPIGPREMSWYLEKVTPFTMQPNGSTASLIDPKSDGTTVTRSVAWIDGKRYGIVTFDQNGHERVFWFIPDEVHLRWRSWLRGGGEAFIRLPDYDSRKEYPEAIIKFPVSRLTAAFQY